MPVAPVTVVETPPSLPASSSEDEQEQSSVVQDIQKAPPKAEEPPKEDEPEKAADSSEVSPIKVLKPS